MSAMSTSEQALRRALAELERRFQERTLELTRKNKELATEIVERKRVEAALRQSKARFKRLSDAGIIGIIVCDIAGNIFEANDAFLNIVGYTHEEVDHGRLHWSELTPHEWAETDSVALEHLRQTGVAPAWEKECLHKDGHRVPILVGVTMLESSPQSAIVECVAFILDLTEKKRAEAAAERLREQQANELHFRALLDAAPDAIVIAGADGHIVFVNVQAEHLFGYARDELIGQGLAALMPERFRGVHDTHVVEYFKNPKVRPMGSALELYGLRKDGTELPIEVSLSPLRSEEGHTTVSAAVRDISVRKRLAEELRHARAIAEAASRAKSEFLSSMSHELRTPLNAILGFAQLLQRDKKMPLSERHKQRVDQILAGGEHLLRLIDDILDLARIESGAVAISIEPLNVWEVLEQVQTTLEPMAASMEVQLKLVTPPSGTPLIAADRTRFVQILMNFGSNAIKYNKPGGSVTFRVEPQGALVRILVSDTGIGIPADKRSKLFQAFQRAGQETGPIEGTGIGLFITKQLAHLMHGHVDFSSVQGVGSDFWVDMPAVREDTETERNSALRGPDSVRQQPTGRRLVLYIEDNPANVAFMLDLMSSVPEVEMLTAPTAEIGIQLAHTYKPSLIIMDINLPGQNGLSALRALRAHPETQHIPVVALSAAASERDKHRGLQAGFSAYLTKPVDVDEFFRVFHRYC